MHKKQPIARSELNISYYVKELISHLIGKELVIAWLEILHYWIKRILVFIC